MSARLSEPSGLDDLLLYKLSRLLAELFRRRGSRLRLEMG
jgi:hypothetical protein